MLSTLMCIKTTFPEVVFYHIKVIQIQAWESVECRNLRKCILKLHSEREIERGWGWGGVYQFATEAMRLNLKYWLPPVL